MIKAKSVKPKVAVLRLSSLGDVVLATSVLAPLTEAGFDVAFVTKKAFAPLLEGHPNVSEVYAYEKGASEKEAREKLFSWFESQEFAFVLDLHDSWRTWSWRARLSRKAPVYVAKKERLREWLILWLRLGKWFSFGRGGRAKKFRRLAGDALTSRGIFATDQGPLTKLHVRAEESVPFPLPAADYAVLLPGSAWRGKEWPYFKELAALLARKVPVVALGGHKDEICDEIAREVPGVQSVRGRSLRESMAVIARAKWVIGNDTGMIHVAEALGKDVAVLEGPTQEQLGFSPYRQNSLLIGLPLFCRPCSKAGRVCIRFGTRKCLNDLRLPVVAEKLRRKGYPC